MVRLWTRTGLLYATILAALASPSLAQVPTSGIEVSNGATSIHRPDRTAVLKDTATPVLFVIGKDDQAVLPEHTLQQSHLPSLAHIHILQRSAHMGMLEEPDKSNRLLQSFLNFVIHT